MSQEFGKGFEERNLRNMRAFFQQFPNWNALRSELSWTHYRLLLRVDAPEARNWYMQETAGQNWSTRVLERHLGTLYYERLLSSRDKAGLLAQTQAGVQTDERLNASSPRDFVRDPMMLEFLGLPGTGQLLESCLERALMDKLTQQAALLGVTKSDFIKDALARVLGMKNSATVLKQVRSAGKMGRPDASSHVSAAMKTRLRAKRVE